MNFCPPLLDFLKNLQVESLEFRAVTATGEACPAFRSAVLSQ
jgi:hypothetical protein